MSHYIKVKTKYRDAAALVEALREQFPEQYEKILGVLERIPGALEKASPSPVSSRVSFAPAPSPGPTPTS